MGRRKTATQFTITVVDSGAGGQEERHIAITIKSPTNSVVYDTTGPQPLKGGNILVRGP